MISVLIYIESRFPTDRAIIRKFVNNHLKEKIRRDLEVGVSIVGDRKMKSLNMKYRNIPETTDVLSFPLDDPSSSTRKDIEAGFSPEMSAPDDLLRLGDVVVSYPQAVMDAVTDNKLVDQKLEELVCHGLDHLMGIHHE